MVYASAGIPAYWLVDPDASRVTVLELRDGTYVEVAVIGAADEVEVSLPFPLVIAGSSVFD